MGKKLGWYVMVIFLLVKFLMKDSICILKMFFNLFKIGVFLCKYVRKCSFLICKFEFKWEVYCIKSIRNKKYIYMVWFYVLL